LPFWNTIPTFKNRKVASSSMGSRCREKGQLKAGS
jgi:hypothetical protein